MEKPEKETRLNKTPPRAAILGTPGNEIQKNMAITHFKEQVIFTSGIADGRTDTPSYRDSRTHQKSIRRRRRQDQNLFH